MKIIAPWGLTDGASQVTGRSVAGDGAKCCRSAKNAGPATVFCFCGRFASQVTQKTQTCDGLSKDLRRGVMRPATKLLSILMDFPNDLERSWIVGCHFDSTV